MKNKKIIISIFSLSLLAVIGLVISNKVLAYQGDYTKKGPNYTEERHQTMEKIMASNDYEAWKKLMPENSRAVKLINKDNFTKFIQAHNLAQQGKIQEALVIRKELGLGNGHGGFIGKGAGRGMGHGNCLAK